MSTVVPQDDDQAAASVSPRRLTLRNVSLVLVVIGLFISGYLSYTHLTDTNIVCVESSVINCETVNGSIYGKLLGIPVAYLGFATDIFLLAILLLEPRVPVLQSYGVLIVFGVVLLGFIYHSFLTYVSFTRIGALCPWCLSHHAIMTILLVITSIRTYRVLFRGEAEYEA